jgi:two-component system, response regulator PdtaR
MSSNARGLVLLAETDPVLGLDLADALETAGYQVTGPIRTVAAAEAWLAQWQPAAAVIEAMLADGSSAGLAQVLRARRVPFLVHAAPGGNSCPGALAGAPRLTRPAWHRDVVELLGQLPQAGTATR